jgi:hypothetical protein
VTIFEPRQTRDWSTRELDALIGRHVQVQINGAELSGVVECASVGRGGCPFIDFTHGGSASWHRDTDEATITVDPIGDQP